MNNCLYSNEIKRRIKVVKEGIYDGLYYCVVSYGSHPCCYVGVPKGNLLHGVECNDVNIDCHGGFSFSSNYLKSDLSKLMDLEEDCDTWLLGWDYSHLGDFYAGLNPSSKGKKWTLQELLEEIKRVIDKIKNYTTLSLYN